MIQLSPNDIKPAGELADRIAAAHFEGQPKPVVLGALCVMLAAFCAGEGVPLSAAGILLRAFHERMGQPATADGPPAGGG